MDRFLLNLMANFFLNSWMPTLFQDSGLSVRQSALTMTLFYFGGIAGGITISACSISAARGDWDVFLAGMSRRRRHRIPAFP